MSIYLNNPWKPVKNQILKNADSKEILFNKGFKIIDSLSEIDIEGLEEIFNNTHNLTSADGGMFYSIYSQDIGYRQEIHQKIQQVLDKYLTEHFVGYKVMLNSFVVKLPGLKSEFYLHQDTTGLDEWKFSPLSLWIPLQDVNESNGCLGIIPNSHAWFSPYRSISFPAPFDGIQTTVKQYLQPLDMKKGNILAFDNRILHNSYQNTSDKPRIAIICGLFPEEASMQTCHKPEYKCGGKVEIIQHEEDYLLTGKNFLIDCQKRPDVGKSLGWVEDPYLEIKVEEFVELCNKNRLFPNENMALSNSDCNLLSEPR